MNVRPLVLVGFALLGCESSSGSSSSGGTTPTPTGTTPTTPPNEDGGVTSTCAPLSGAGTKHTTAIMADETWTAAASPHVVTVNQSIPAGRTLTIEPCAVVKVEPNVGFLVEGKLVALGAASTPIRIERAGDAAWRSIETRKGAELRLAHTTVEGGGNANGGRLTQFGMIDVRGDQDVAPQPIFFADHVTLKGSASLGIWMREGGGFAAGSTELTITGGATFPLLVWTNAASALPTGRYTGNAIDEIFLPAMGSRDQVKADTTLANRGVPYRVGGETGGTSLTVGEKGVRPLLTIEAGTTLRFAKDTRLLVSYEGENAIGALRAEGRADAPIVFTSAEATPKAGDWGGIQIGGTPDARDSIAHATIAYAGGTTGISSFGCPSPPAGTFVNEGGVVIHGGKPSGAFVKNTRIENSAGDGIVRGWTGDEIDFMPSNTFTNVARCNQTAPKPIVGVCSDVCPK